MKGKEISREVRRNLEHQGRKATWLSVKLDMSRATLYNRLSDGEWNINDVAKMKELGVIN